MYTMNKTLTFLKKNYMYLIIGTGYIHWCFIVSDFIYMDYHFSFKLLMIGLGFFGWYLIYILVKKYLAPRNENSEDDLE
jgi:hypothetical protein